MKKLLFSLLLLVLLFLVACSPDAQESQQQVEQLPLAQPQQERIILTCPENYIMVGEECCLDENRNNVCDDEEVVNTPEPEVQDLPDVEEEAEEEQEEVEAIEQDNNNEPAEMVVAFPTSKGISDPYAVVAQPELDFQPVNKKFTDPAFGTTLRRLADAPSGSKERHEYSQLQAFNKDSSLVLLFQGEQPVIRDTNTLKEVFRVDFENNALRWNPANKDELIYFDSNDVGSGNVQVVLQKTNVKTGVQEDIYTFPDQYVRISPAISWEEMSHDGKWITAYLYKQNEELDFVALNVETKKLGAILDRQKLLQRCDSIEGGPNWVAPSPSGKYMVIQWNRDGNTPCSGVEAYDIQTGSYKGHVASHRQHSDMGFDENGNEVYVTSYYGNSNFLTTTKFPGKQNFDVDAGYDKIIVDHGWFHFGHISCQGPAGVCVVSGDYDQGGFAGDDAFSGEIYLVYTSGQAQDNEQNDNALVQRLAHHRSTTCDYYHQAQPSISRDGKYVIFASDWGDCNQGSDSYIVELEQ